MHTANDICSLDYLIGTLSTAYKGAITSLVAKDFCMTDEGDAVTLKGRVLSLPAGDYKASLIQSGSELARTAIGQGYFELKAQSERVKQAKDLQIDIIQGNGRHIGTFLLKKESSDGFYISAVELSEELKGMDFKRLTIPLRDKVGLLQKAEEIITKILSTKKDWPAFSELLNGFTSDVFWSSRDAFYGSFPIVVHFSLKAAERTDAALTSKPIANFLDCIGLPLEHEADSKVLRSLVDIWLNELNGSSVDLSAQLRAVVRIFASIHEKFPDAKIAPALIGLLESLRKKLSAMPALGASTLQSFRTLLERDEYADLARYGDGRREELLQELVGAGRDLAEGTLDKALAFLGSLDADLFDDGKMIAAVYEAIVRNMNAESTDEFAALLINIFSLFPKLSPKALDAMKANAPIVVKKLVSFNRIDACAGLLAAISKIGPPIKDEIVMGPGIAETILRSDSEALISQYVSALDRIVIPTSKVRALSNETWAEVVDPRHLELLTKFTDILRLGDGRFRSVLVHVIANLFLSGVYIPDDRLFQRSVSSYLNSKAMRGHFLLNYLFLQKLPVYFNEVGAVDAIRDFSTEIDSWGNDPVLYFLRKQVHVNASNYNVRLIEKVMASWVYNDPGSLREAVPGDVYASLKPGLIERYSEVIKPFFESLGVLDAHGLHWEKLLAVPEEKFKAKAVDVGLPEISSKVMLLCRLYREIVKKYSLAGPGLDLGDAPAALEEYVGRIKKLGRTVLAPEVTAAQEALFFKRHIAFGIPSVLGTYHEPKFDALGALLRDDATIRVLLEKVILSVAAKEREFTKADAYSWLLALATSYEALKLHGFENMQVEELVLVMKKGGLHLSQVADMLKMWQKELAWMVEFFNLTFHKPLLDILGRFPKDDLPEYLMNLNTDDPDFASKAADIVIRNMISSVPGLVEADRMIERIMRAFKKRREISDDVINEEKTGEEIRYFLIQELSDQKAARLAPVLGGKAKNLVYLRNRGFRVPAGVVFSALLTKQFETLVNSADFGVALQQGVKKLEDETKTFFGNPERPLFLSVRSGSYVSMPGILSTILYCGMNRETLQGFIRTTKDPRLGWDSYRRFIEHYATAALGIDIGVFEAITSDVMKTFGLKSHEQLKARHLEELAGRYLQQLKTRGLAIPDDVYVQLRQSVRAIYASWFSERAEQFRRATSTSAEWGTAVTLMQMVSGNAPGSGASVFFTRNPFSYELKIYGETRENASGDDLVSGRRMNRPLSKGQAGNGQKSLEEIDPGLFELHQELAMQIERAMGGLPQDVEATYTKGPDGKQSLFVLQTRRMEFSADYARTFDEICGIESRIIGRGIGVHGGALSGVASFARSVDQAVRLREKSGMPVILLRTTADTEDVSLMPAVRGIITSSGGVTSHAAVLAQKFGVNAVASCSDMLLKIDEQGQPFALIGETIIKEGAPISLDGTTGLVFSGACLQTTRSERY